MLIFLVLTLPFIGSTIAVLLPSNARNIEAWLAGVIALTCALFIASQYNQILDGQIITSTIEWLPSLGLNLSIRLDGFSWLFSIIIAVMGVLIVLYARYYMSPQDPVPRFFSFLLAFMGSMLGVVLSGNLIQLVIFWELTSLSSFMLIAYWHHRLDARRGARMSLLITGGGGFCLLGAVLIIGHILGSYDLDYVLASGDIIKSHKLYNAVLILFALGVLTKSAQFPFHVWLPNAMAAPTPVSAYLHSATMVKAGVFLMARFWPVLSGTPEWALIIGGAGLLSLLIGAYAATFQLDTKGLLAYSTISHLGLITLLLGMNSSIGLVAAVFHIINHATFKASLFMAAGIVDHETGTRDMNRLSGLYRYMPITATLAIVAAASMAGVPLLNGFISKEMFFAETIFASEHSLHKYALPIAAVLAGVLSVTYSTRFITQVFFGKSATDLPRQPHEPPLLMLIPSAILVFACLLVGIVPNYTVGPILYSSTLSILQNDMPNYHLGVWHGLNIPLVMSFLALSGGLILAWSLQKYHNNTRGLTPIIYRFDGRRSFEWLIEFIDLVSIALLSLLKSNRLQIQILVIVICSLIVASLPLHGSGFITSIQTTPLDPFFALLWLAGSIAAIAVAHQAKYHRPRALLLSGATGLATCLTFAWLSAPDLALTQLAVETVTIVLILLGLRWLPRRLAQDEPALFSSLRVFSRRIRDFTIALLVGAGMTALSYALLTKPSPKGLGSFFVEKSLPLGGGANVVNVILVDFRAFDTLGEITVLGVVALSVFALLRRFRPPIEVMEIPIARRRNIVSNKLRGRFIETNSNALVPEGVMRIPAVLSRMLLPIATMVSIYFLLRGHNLPGGGFVGGLIFATALILQYIVGGVTWVEARPRIHPQHWLSFGLLCSASAAILVWVAKKPFLSAISSDIHIPYIGTLHISSVLLFDIGVYLLVVGASVLMLVALAHQSLRLHRLTAIAQAKPENPEDK